MFTVPESIICKIVEFLGRPSSEQGANQEESLPFLMPKLHRSAMINSQTSEGNGNETGGGLSITQQQHPAAVRQLSLTLPFPGILPTVCATGGVNDSCNIPVYKDLADDSKPIDRQRYTLNQNYQLIY